MGPRGPWPKNKKGGQSNSHTLTFKIYFNKGHGSEDAYRRESMTCFVLRSFCRLSEKLYKKLVLFPAKWQQPNRYNFQA